MPTPRKTASTSSRDRAQPRAVDSRREPELDTERAQRTRLVGEGMTLLAVGRDRVANEPSHLFALVEDRDGVSARGQFAGAREPRRAGADHGDAAAVRSFSSRSG